jgi:NAD(P)-dependent dehydrogenase (short-subunit alcohol dehydrogenase family)
MSQIANRNILVTGGANGMGRQTAKKLAALSGNVAVSDIDAGNLDAVVRDISSAGGGTALSPDRHAAGKLLYSEFCILQNLGSRP